MRGANAFLLSLASLTIFISISYCQVPPQAPSESQIQRQFVLERFAAENLETRDGKLDDAPLRAYVQRIFTRVGDAVGRKSLEIRITASPDEYVELLPSGALYVSSGLLERIDNEAELAGLFAHELAHGSGLVTRQNPGASIPLITPACILASPRGVFMPATYRDAEIRATNSAIGNLKLAGYDPSAVLDLLSKLSYEHPAWSKAIVADDLLTIRATIEAEAVPPAGYQIDSSEFTEQHARLVQALAQAKKTPRPMFGPSKIN
jgi:beta-barrel assembly-enhancing protease